MKWLGIRLGAVLPALMLALGACSDEAKILAPAAEQPSLDRSGDGGSDDRGRIAFIIDEPAGNPLLHTMNADGSRIQAVRNAGWAQYPAWSPDRRQIAYFSTPESGNPASAGLYVINAAGGKPVRIFEGMVSHPRWSPDGTRIAFSHFPLGGRRSIYVIGADGSGVTQVTGGPSAFDMNPSWSPDGQRIAFWSSRSIAAGRSEYGNLWIVNADGTGLKPITDCETAAVLCHSPTWSPVDDRIAFRLKAGTELAIGTVDANGGEIQVILSRTDHGVQDLQPAWSPDGTRFVFLSAMNGTGQRELYTVNADGTNPTRITSMTQVKYFPAWGR